MGFSGKYHTFENKSFYLLYSVPLNATCLIGTYFFCFLLKPLHLQTYQSSSSPSSGSPNWRSNSSRVGPHSAHSSSLYHPDTMPEAPPFPYNNPSASFNKNRYNSSNYTNMNANARNHQQQPPFFNKNKAYDYRNKGYGPKNDALCISTANTTNECANIMSPRALSTFRQMSHHQNHSPSLPYQQNGKPDEYLKTKAYTNDDCNTNVTEHGGLSLASTPQPDDATESTQTSSNTTTSIENSSSSSCSSSTHEAPAQILSSSSISSSQQQSISPHKTDTSSSPNSIEQHEANQVALHDSQSQSNSELSQSEAQNCMIFCAKKLIPGIIIKRVYQKILDLNR